MSRGCSGDNVLKIANQYVFISLESGIHLQPSPSIWARSLPPWGKRKQVLTSTEVLLIHFEHRSWIS